MCFLVVLRGFLLCALFVSIVSSKHGMKCTQERGCVHQRFLPASAAGRMAVRPKQSQHSMRPQLSRISVRFNKSSSTKARTVHTRQTTGEMIQVAVEMLANDIIIEHMLKEGSIGIHLEEYRDSVAEGLSSFKAFVNIWHATPPTIGEFLGNISVVLDDLKVGSVAITDDLVRIQAYGTNSDAPITKLYRLHYKSKHISDAKIANEIQGGLKAGTYDFSDIRGRRILFRTSNHTDVLAVESSSGRTTNENSNTKRTQPDWWKTIVSVQLHLHYADLWMTFLEELGSKLETIEAQVEPRRSQIPGEFSRWYGSSNINSENIIEALERMNKEYALYSIRNNIIEVATTADENRLRNLNEIVRISLKVGPKCSIRNSSAYVVAPYLLMSQVINCTSYISMINTSINYIFAIGGAKLYVDDDLTARSVTSPKLEHGKGFHVVVVAPEIKVVGGFMRSIDVSGRKPSNYIELSHTFGEPGLPGEEGGRFFGFSLKLSASQLKIILNGGMGGKGQDGNIDYKYIMACFDQYTDGTVQANQWFCCAGSKTTKWVYKGVHGGQAGIGAPPGRYTMFLLTNNGESKLLFEQNNGSIGEVGIGWDDYGSIRDGYTPSDATLKELGVVVYKTEIWCVPKSNKERYRDFPLSNEESRELKGRNGESPIKPLPPVQLPNEPEKSVRGILKYKTWARKHAHVLNARTIYDFISSMELNETIRNLYSTIDLIDEFIYIGRQPLGGFVDREILKLSYKSLGSRALSRALNYTGENKEDHERVLLFLSNAALSKFILISHPYEHFIVVNMKEFLQVEKSRVEDLKDTAKENLQYGHISRTLSNYNAMISAHLEEAGFFINNTINPEFDEIEMKIEQLQQFLIETIAELKKDPEANKMKLEEYREKLKNHRIVNVISNFCKTITDAVAVFHPVAGAVTAGVDFANLLMNPMPGAPSIKPVMIPAAVSAGSQYSALRFRKSTNNSMNAFKRQLQAVKTKLKEMPEVFPNALQTIADITSGKVGYDSTSPMDSFPPADCLLSYKNLLGTETKIKEMLSNVSLAIKADIKALEGENTRTSTKADPTAAAEIAGVATAVLNGATSLFKNWKQDTENIKEVAAAIKASDANVGALQDHINNIETEIIPEMHNLFQSLSNTREDLASQSSVALVVIKHRMQSAVRNIQVDFKKEFLKGTGLEPYFERGLESLEDAMVTLINIYERLDAYKEQVKMANFTAEVALHPKQYLGKLNDTKLQKKFDQLRYTFQGDVLLKRQSLVEGSYRMWKFPMVDPVLCEYQNLSTTSISFETPQKVRALLIDIEKRINNLIEIIRLAVSSIGPGDKYILKTAFKHSDRSGAFYVWKNSSSGQFISTLMQGKAIFLHSKPDSGPKLCEAIKFNRIALTFLAINSESTLQDEFNLQIKKYAVTMIHGGNSFYLFANQTYVIPGEKIELIFSFELDDKGFPKIRNEVYNKLLFGELTLSPYTTWSIKLSPLEGNGFENLSPFVGLFDMYLEGAGSCVLLSFAREGDYVSPDCTGIF